MKKEQKTEVITSLQANLEAYAHYYLADISGLNAASTAALRKKCFDSDIKLVVVKNTFFNKALEGAGKTNEDIQTVLAGPSAVFFSNIANAPAKLMVDFCKKSGLAKPELKAAFVDECTYVGADQLKVLASLKSREELIGDVIALLQSPAKNVISALQGNAGQKIAGLVKALEERTA